MRDVERQRSTLDQTCAAAVAAVLATLLATGTALAGTSAGCLEVGGGRLNVTLSASGTVAREATLTAGDVISFQVQGASVSLASGAGAPLALIGDEAAAATTFTAPVSGSYTFGFTSVGSSGGQVTASCVSAATAAANAAFLNRRRALLNDRDPDRLRIDRPMTPLDAADKPLSSSIDVTDNDGRPKNVEFSVSLSEIAAASQGNKKVDPGIIDFWLEGRMRNYDASSVDRGNLGVLYLGTRSMVGPDIMLGGLAQFDRGVESDRYGEAELTAKGWMAGPYVSMKLGPGVVFDGRAAWGETENIATSLEDENSLTGRRLVRGKLTGTRQVNGWSVAPSIGLVYVEDAVRDADSGETRASGSGKVEVLPELSRRFALDGETFIEPRAALGAFVGFDDLSALNPATSTHPTDVQLKAEAGIAVGVKDGSTLQATGGVESGSSTAAGSWAGRLQFNVPLGQ